MKHLVKEFGQCTGTLPKDGELSKEDLFIFLRPLVKKIQEELDEFEDALNNKDVKEILDARTDLQVYLDQLTTSLEAAGVDVKLAEELVCTNNAEKYSTSYDFIEAKYLEWKENDVWFFNKLRIDGNVHNGISYFCLKDEDNKVRKFKDFPKVDLKPCVPKDLL